MPKRDVPAGSTPSRPDVGGEANTASASTAGAADPPKRNLAPQIMSARPAASGSRSPASSPLEVFALCIQRASNLLKLHADAHGKQARPPRHLADAHRAAVVLSVSALDAYVRMLILVNACEILARPQITCPPALAERARRLVKDDALFDAARHGDLITRFDKALKTQFDRESFQGTASITDAMKMLGIEDVFHEVAKRARKNEDKVREDLDRFTKRRHLIAHRGDYDLTVNPPAETSITKTFAQECIALMKVVAETIDAIVAEKIVRSRG